jgi:hypothetical protein
MYDRTHPGLHVGHDDAGLAVAMIARQGANVDTAVADLTARVNYLRGKGLVFVVGYCFGGRDDLAGGWAHRGDRGGVELLWRLPGQHGRPNA